MMKQTGAEKTKQTESHTYRRETTTTDSPRQDRAQGTTQAVNAAPAVGWALNRVLLTLGAAGPVLFLVVSTLLGMLDPGFDVMTEPVSALAWGPLGWVQSANFYALGAATIAFAVGLYRDLKGRGRREPAESTDSIAATMPHGISGVDETKPLAFRNN
jgi:hypothetical protein